MVTRTDFHIAALVLAIFLPFSFVGLPKQVLMAIPAIVSVAILLRSYTVVPLGFYLSLPLLILPLISSFSGYWATGEISDYWWQDYFWHISSLFIFIVACTGRLRKTATYLDLSFAKTLLYVLIYFELAIFVVSRIFIEFNYVFSFLYSEDVDVYSAGYNLYRHFGIVGQPGRYGLVLLLELFVVSLVTKGVFYRSIDLRLILIFLIAMTQSRLPLIVGIVYFGYELARSAAKIPAASFAASVSLGLVAVCAYLVFDVEGVFLQSRIVNADLLTASHRIFLKEWAFSEVSKSAPSLLFGFGANEDYLRSLHQGRAEELSLWTPDSSQTVYLVRSGLIGSCVIYGILFVAFYCFSKKLRALRTSGMFYVQAGMVITYSFFDPVFHSFKAAPLFLIIFLLWSYEANHNRT